MALAALTLVAGPALPVVLSAFAIPAQSDVMPAAAGSLGGGLTSVVTLQSELPALTLFAPLLLLGAIAYGVSGVFGVRLQARPPLFTVPGAGALGPRARAASRGHRAGAVPLDRESPRSRGRRLPEEGRCSGSPRSWRWPSRSTDDRGGRVRRLARRGHDRPVGRAPRPGARARADHRRICGAGVGGWPAARSRRAVARRRCRCRPASASRP